jgi:hypothetical protein
VTSVIHARHRRACLVLALVAGLLALPLAGRAAACEQETSQPFAPWGDPAAYTLVPDGHFEAGDAWRLDDGAAIVDDNEPFGVGGPEHGRALYLPPGSSALSPPVCITEAHPTLRAFSRGSGLLGGAALLSVVLGDDTGRLLELPVGVLTGGPAWKPTPATPILVNALAPLTPTGELSARFRVTPILGSVWLDGVYVDPWKTT